MYRNQRSHDPQGSGRGRPRDQRAENAILQAALELFGEGGLAATTFDGVARRASVSRSTVYRRWRTREELLLAALDALRAQGEVGVEDWAERSFADVMTIFSAMTARALTDRRSMDLLRQMTALPPDNPVKIAYWSTVVQPRRDAFAAMLSAARERGEVPPGADPDLIQDQLAGALVYRALMNPAPLSDREAADYVRGLLESLRLTGTDGPTAS